jgi:hypothetical protein
MDCSVEVAEDTDELLLLSAVDVFNVEELRRSLAATGLRRDLLA